MTHISTPLQAPVSGSGDQTKGILLVAGSALVWSFGGTIARYLTVDDTWTVVFWRSAYASIFLLLFMIWRDGPKGTVKLFTNMGWPGLVVALCFATASMSFVVALQYTTVANILLMQAGVPLLAALLAWVAFREQVRLATWIAIAAVISGVAIMVSDSIGGKVSLIGDGLAVVISFAFAIATVVTRRHREVRMVPANCLGTTIACCVAFSLAGGYSVGVVDTGLLFLFGAINLGMGLAMFSYGARILPAALTALIGTLEPVAGPVWVWLFHNEIPNARTLTGGLVVFSALMVHLFLEWKNAR